MRPHLYTYLYAYAGEMHPTYAGEVTPHARYTTRKTVRFLFGFISVPPLELHHYYSEKCSVFYHPCLTEIGVFGFSWHRIAPTSEATPSHPKTPTSPPLKITHSTPVSDIFFKFVNSTFHRGDRLTPVHLCRSTFVPTIDNSQIYFIVIFRLLWYQSHHLKTEQTGATSINFGSFAQPSPPLNRVFHSPLDKIAKYFLAPLMATPLSLFGFTPVDPSYLTLSVQCEIIGADRKGRTLPTETPNRDRQGSATGVASNIAPRPPP